MLATIPLNGKPQCEVRFVQTFYWHRNDTADFESYGKAKKYVLAIVFLQSMFKNSSHAITLSTTAVCKLCVVEYFCEAKPHKRDLQTVQPRSGVLLRLVM